jgi:hypothetical protein
MAQWVVVENHKVEAFIGSLLTSHPIAGRYTSIVHLYKKKGSLVGKKYTWAQYNMQPLGMRVPAQCDAYGFFRSFSKRKKGTLTDYKECSGLKGNGTKCNARFLIEPVVKSEHPDGASDWLMFDWP